MNTIEQITQLSNDIDNELQIKAQQINEQLIQNQRQFALISEPKHSDNITLYTIQPCKLDLSNQSELLVTDGDGVIYIDLGSFLSGFTLPQDQLMKFINDYGEYYYSDVISPQYKFIEGFSYLGSIEQSLLNGDDSPVFAFNRAFWLRHNLELANIANSLTNSIH